MAVVATETVVGSHVLTIDGYAKTMAALAVGESIKSEPFRVGGQTWRIVCYPRGEDEELAADGWVCVSLLLWGHHHGGGHEVKARPRLVLLGRRRAGAGAGDGEELHSDAPALPHTFSFAAGGGRAPWRVPEFIRRETLEAHLVVDDDDCFRIRCDVAVVVTAPPEPLPPPELHRRNLGDVLLETEVGRDVTFVVAGDGEHEQQVFTAHSCVLAARSSPAFMAEVLGTAGDNNEDEGAVVVVGVGGGGGSRHVAVDGVAPRVLEAMLHFIYTESLPDELLAHQGDSADEIAAVQGLLAAADRYGMAALALACSELLVATEVGRDVTLVVGDEVFTAHMSVLAARSSPAFMVEVLAGGGSGGGGARSRHVRFGGEPPWVFKALLRFIYTDSLADVDDDEDGGDDEATVARALLPVAHRYGMERLEMVCSDVLCRNIDADMVLDTMKLAHRHGCVKLNKACVTFIRGMLDAFDLEDTK